MRTKILLLLTVLLLFVKITTNSPCRILAPEKDEKMVQDKL